MARDSSQNKGFSLAKGPVAILGLIGIVYGLSALIFASHGFGLHIPHGAVHGKKWIGLEVNGWSELLFIAAGLTLFFAAPLHWGAKSMALLVGLVMIAAAVVAVIRANGVFGIFAANHLTELVWAAAGVLLLVLALLPRVGGGAAEEKSQGRSEHDQPRRHVQVRRVTTANRQPQSTATVTRDVDIQRSRSQQVSTETSRSAGARVADDNESTLKENQ
jgi:hypothetical protein